jgi:predicted protein tyrosine phosphatase
MTIRRLVWDHRRAWPWLLLVLSTLPALWYILAYPTEIDPEFPRVQRPTFSAYPPFAYRLAEPADTIDHVAMYEAAAALVLCAWGLWRDRGKRAWVAALALSMAAFWDASTPGPLVNGWHGLGWRLLPDPLAPIGLRLGLAVFAATLAAGAIWGLWGWSPRSWWRASKETGTLGLFLAAAILFALHRAPWLDREPFGYWPRWIHLWSLLAWSLALLRLVPRARPGWERRLALPLVLLAWLALDFTGRGLFWYQRPLRRLREIVPGRVYLSAMPTYRGLELAQERHHFRTIINLFPEFTPEKSPHWPDEVRFAREHGIRYIGTEPDDPTGENFVIRTIAIARDPSAWPILVHCHASMDRSPAWTGIYRFVVQGWSLADAIREIEHHRGLRPAASVTLLYNRVLPRLAPERWSADPTAALLVQCAAGTVDPAVRMAARPEGRDDAAGTARTEAPPRRR